MTFTLQIKPKYITLAASPLTQESLDLERRSTEKFGPYVDQPRLSQKGTQTQAPADI